MGSGSARLGILAAVLVGLALPAGAESVRKERVEFAAGATATTVEGSLGGYDSVEYQLGASAGQQMAVGLEASNPQAYFNIFAPGDVPGKSEALFIGARDGLDFSGKLTASGDYTVQVFLMRAAARRGENTSYKLHVEINGTAEPAPDFADGLAGGPDVWEVAGVAEGDTLNLRAGPSSREAVLGQFANGTRLRNLGCKLQGAQRWCQVETTQGVPLSGWVAGRYLREAGPETGDAKVEGTAFNATGNLPCATVAGQPTGTLRLRRGARLRGRGVGGGDAARGRDPQPVLRRGPGHRVRRRRPVQCHARERPVSDRRRRRALRGPRRGGARRLIFASGDPADWARTMPAT